MLNQLPVLLVSIFINSAIGLASTSIKPEPLGVVLVVTAWNYPFSTGLPPMVSAIAAGNSVVVKPSEMAPYSSKAFKKLVEKYMKPEFYRVIEGKVEVAKAVSKLPFDMICFTGSTVTGRLVAIEAAKNLTPCIMELGGKCPIIVDETAEMDVSAFRVLFGKFVNSGQTCIGADHVFVHESVKEKFVKVVLEKAEEMYGNGQNIEDNGSVGKIIN